MVFAGMGGSSAGLLEKAARLVSDGHKSYDKALA